jgi:tol-pal system protein YbgF
MALLLLAALGAALPMGCASLMQGTEQRLDAISRDTRVLRAQQDSLAAEVADIRGLLQSEGLVGDERRAELLSRLRSLEKAVEQQSARSQEQEVLLRRMSAGLDQLTRQPGALAGPAVGGSPGAGPAEISPEGAGSAGAGRWVPVPGDTIPPQSRPPGSGQKAAPPGAAGSAAGPASGDSAAAVLPASEGSSELVIYDAAMRDYARGSFALARDGFEELLRRFPQSELADNAAYWVGETYYAEGKFAQALDSYEQVLRSYLGGDTAPAAMLKTGYCKLELGDRVAAAAAFQRLRRQYPDSDEAVIAANKLQAMGNSR